MSWLSALLGLGDDRREVDAQPPAPPVVSTSAPVPASQAKGGSATARSLYPSEALLGTVLMGMRVPDALTWAAALAPECQAHGITTPSRVASFLANMHYETDGFRQLREDLNYTRAALIATFGKARITSEQAIQLGRAPGAPALTLAQQEAIANVVYGGAWGLRNLGNRLETPDASRFIGRGLIQLTGRANYQVLAQATGRDIDTLPEWLETTTGAAASAAAFWEWMGCNTKADAENYGACRRAVNGGYLGLSSVLQLIEQVQSLLTAGA